MTSQLLYEIASPPYLGPDVRPDSTRFTWSKSQRTEFDISASKGEPPPPTLKVAMNEVGGYRKDLSIALTGLDIEAKAKLVEEAFWFACPYDPDDFDSVTTKVIRTDKADPQQPTKRPWPYGT